MNETFTKDTADLFSQMFNLQKDLGKKWLEMMDKMQKTAASKDPDKKENVWQDPSGLYMKMYNQWRDVFNKQLAFLSPLSFSQGILGDTFSRIFNSADIYLVLQKFWGKVMPKLKDTGDPEKLGSLFKDYIDEYKKVVNVIFGLTTDNLQKMMHDLQNIAETTFAAPAKFFQADKLPIYNLYASMAKLFKGDPEAFAEMTRAFGEAAGKPFGFLLDIPALGYSREHQEKFNQVAKAFADYLNQVNEYNIEIGRITSLAMEVMFKKVSAPEVLKKITSFKDFFDFWVTVNEETFYNNFKTEKYAKIQGKLVSSGLKLKVRIDEFAESFLKQSSLSSKKEVDQISQELHQLKKELKDIKKKIYDTGNQGHTFR